MRFIAIIPARYESTRFPGKPLALLKGKPMVQWVYENVVNAVEKVWVATDDDRILNATKGFGGQAIKTMTTHQSGTDRCAEAAQKLAERYDFDVVINVQGDEPFIQKEQIELLKSCFSGETQIATLIKKIESTEELLNPNRPKVVIDNKKNALYFSRSPIPYIRNAGKNDWLQHQIFWAHVGMYAYKTDVLQKITCLKQGKLELAESLEQLRWIENGFKISTVETTYQSVGIDTPEDMQFALSFLKSNTK